jgi:hypothetical protein
MTRTYLSELSSPKVLEQISIKFGIGAYERWWANLILVHISEVSEVKSGYIPRNWDELYRLLKNGL